MFRTHPQLHKKPDPSVSRKENAFKATKKKRAKRVRRRIEKFHVTPKNPDVVHVGDVVDFEPTKNQVLKGVTTHGRKMQNDPIFRRRVAVA
jgi:hypothetical protein